MTHARRDLFRFHFSHYRRNYDVVSDNYSHDAVLAQVLAVSKDEVPFLRNFIPDSGLLKFGNGMFTSTKCDKQASRRSVDLADNS